MQPHRPPGRHARMRTLPALLVLTATACSRGTTPPAAAPSTTPPVATTAVAPTTAPPTTVAPGETRSFLSPTKNIGCAIDATTAGCDIREKTWTPPPKPSSCEFDWGFGMYVRVGPPAVVSIACASDTVYDTQAPVLAYGQSLRAGQLQCTSGTDGITCKDLTSGKGFRVSRESYTFF